MNRSDRGRISAKCACSDKRLAELVKQALHALEDPAAGFVFDDFDRRYREAEGLREKKSAAWYYHDKTSFETKYAEDSDDLREPAWVSDKGRGTFELRSVAEADLDGVPREPLWLVLWRKKRLELKPKHRAVLDALAVDWRTGSAAKLAGVSRPTVDQCKKNFKTHFAQCLWAWKHDFSF